MAMSCENTYGDDCMHNLAEHENMCKICANMRRAYFPPPLLKGWIFGARKGA